MLRCAPSGAPSPRRGKAPPPRSGKAPSLGRDTERWSLNGCSSNFDIYIYIYIYPSLSLQYVLWMLPASPKLAQPF
ncbi:hypothetical protein N9L68_07660 [bacterium]|nr:hypothetical protein [bacterium]